MPLYLAYNLRIESALGLPELVPIADATDQPPDVMIQWGNLSQVNTLSLDHEFVGTVEEVGRFLIRSGQEIVIDPVDTVDPAHLRTILLGPIFSILLRQRGLLVLHASAVKIGDRAVAFMGGSGWGKSTLVTAFHARGYDVLTDDVLPLQLGDSQPLVSPSYPHFKLCPDAADSLRTELSPIFEGAHKLAYTFTQGFQQTPLPLHRIYVLGKGDRHEITPLSPAIAFLNLVQHTRAMISLQEPHFLASHFQLCTDLISQVTFSRFVRKPALEDLPALIALIEADVLNDIAQSATPDKPQNEIQSAIQDSAPDISQDSAQDIAPHPQSCPSSVASSPCQAH